jgi:hypothetical protein
MKIKLFLLTSLFFASPTMAQQGSITLYQNLCKSCHLNKEELFTKNTINKNNFNKTIFKMFTTYSNYKPTTAQLENMKSLAKATANKKLYLEITNINGKILGETNEFITIKFNNKFAQTNDNFTISKTNQFTVEHNNKIYNLKTKIGTYIK